MLIGRVDLSAYRDEDLRGAVVLHSALLTFCLLCTSVTSWKRETQEGLKALFERQRGRRRADEGQDVEALYSQIGRLQVQLEGLKKSPDSTRRGKTPLDRTGPP